MAEKVSVGSGPEDDCIVKERVSKYKSVILSRAWVDGNYVEVDTKAMCMKWQSAFRREGYFTYRRETKNGRWRAYIRKSRTRKSPKHAHHAKPVAARRDTGVPSGHNGAKPGDAPQAETSGAQAETGETVANV